MNIFIKIFTDTKAKQKPDVFALDSFITKLTQRYDIDPGSFRILSKRN